MPALMLCFLLISPRPDWNVLTETGSGFSLAGSEPALNVPTRSWTSCVVNEPDMMPLSVMVAWMFGAEYTSSSNSTAMTSPTRAPSVFLWRVVSLPEIVAPLASNLNPTAGLPISSEVG